MKKLLAYFNALDTKQRAAFLKTAKTGENYLRKTIHTGNVFGTKLCNRIIAASGGRITCKDLRPNDWREHWPPARSVK